MNEVVPSNKLKMASDTKKEENIAVTSQSITKEFFESSTIHGLSPMYSAKNIYTRIFWITVFTTSFSLLTWQVAKLITKIYKYETVTNIQSTLLENMEFPAVTLCNVIPFRQSQLDKLDLSFMQKLDKTLTETEQKRIVRVQISRMLGKMPDKELYNLGHSNESFLLPKLKLCSFSDKKCKLGQDFRTIMDPSIGNCFQFGDKTKTQNQSGPESGLSIVVNVNQDDYGDTDSSSFPGAGAMLLIGQFGMLIDSFTLENRGILLLPGTLTKIKIEKKVVKRLPAPYPDECVQNKHTSELFGVHFKDPFPYSSELCKTFCFIRLQMEFCGYISSNTEYLMQHIIDVKNSNISFGNATGKEDILKEYKCLRQSTRKYNKGKLKCDCRPACYEERFRVKYSSAMWPSHLKSKQLLQNIQSKYKSQRSYANWTTADVYQNLLKLEVYFEDFTVETIEQRPAYGWDDFLSDLGGQAGLWIGASVFSWLEVSSLLINVMAYFLCTRPQRLNKQKREVGDDLEKNPTAEPRPVAMDCAMANVIKNQKAF